MLQPGRHETSDSYRYGFQGQESDDEIKGEGNSLNYKYRMHDPRIGRFFATDPLEAKYPWNSPYAFSENRVIDGVELEGLEVEIIISDIPNGETEIRVIGSENIKGAPQTIKVPTYPLIISDPATGTTTVHSVTRDAPYIKDTNAKPDKKGNFKITNIPFEPKVGPSTIYEGEERKTFMSTELPSIRLRQKGSTTLDAVPVDSEWRTNKDQATNINIHVGGQYTTSTTSPGKVNITGSEGCFTVVGGNQGMLDLQNDIDARQEKLKEADMPTNITVEVDKRESFDKTFTVPQS